MSSFLMSYPHVQGSVGIATGYEPKFPPSETEFHHLHHHHHSGYGPMSGITATSNQIMDYNYHNGYNYGSYGAPSPSTPFYHHHPPYGSPQMHQPANASSPNPSSQSSSYVTNIIPNDNSAGSRTLNVESRIVNGLNISETSTNVDNIGYYNYYQPTATTNEHHPQDLPIQCPISEPPANTVLGLQELGEM